MYKRQEYVGLERSTMVRNVSTLEKHGLIHVVKGKGKVFELTEFGRDTIEKAIPIWEKAQNEIKEYIGEEAVSYTHLDVYKRQNILRIHQIHTIHSIDSLFDDSGKSDL